MACINPTVSGFKAQFPSLPYIPEYISGMIYFKGDIVYVEPNFYQSLVDNNTSDVSDTEKWTPYAQSKFNYINDEQISEAITEAQINFNPELFGGCGTANTVFYYLVGHYLVVDLNIIQAPFATGFLGLLQSKSVGSVSASFGLPQWVMNDPNLGLYAQTQFGLKYLSLLLPYLNGQLFIVQGKTTFLDD